MLTCWPFVSEIYWPGGDPDPPAYLLLTIADFRRLTMATGVCISQVSKYRQWIQQYYLVD